MKAFKTEKHNIPEGATHYSNEEIGKYFCWYKDVNGKDKIMLSDGRGFSDVWWDCEHNEHLGVCVKPIPQPNVETPEEKEVEWKSGDRCIYMSEEFLFVGMIPTLDDFSCVIFSDTQGAKRATTIELSKPETQKQREERERLEAAYDLYCEFTNSNQEDATCMSMYGFKMSQVQCRWLAIVDKTNYRKESE